MLTNYVSGRDERRHCQIRVKWRDNEIFCFKVHSIKMRIPSLTGNFSDFKIAILSDQKGRKCYKSPLWLS